MISTWRKPTWHVVTSTTLPAASFKVSSSRYRFGCSADHLAGLDDRFAEGHGRLAGRIGLAVGGQVLQDGLAGCVQQFGLDRERLGPVGEVLHLHIDSQLGVAVLLVEFGMDEEVAEVQVGGRPEVHVAVDAAQTPEVLVLQVAAVAVAVDFDGQHVRNRPAGSGVMSNTAGVRLSSL